MKPAPATLSNERHKGAFAAGTSLSMGNELKALDPSPVKEVQLDTTHKIIEIAPGVKFSAWTFGGQVPGPTVRARVGDQVLPGLFVEFPVEEGHAAGPVVDELPGAQLTGDGQDEFIESVVGSPGGRQGGRGRELGQDLPVPGRLREHPGSATATIWSHSDRCGQALVTSACASLGGALVSPGRRPRRRR